MKKLLASDIDGTLLHKTDDGGTAFYAVDPSVFEAIKKFRKQGNLFILCTGRTLQGVRAFLNEFPMEADGAIISGGASFHFIEQSRPFASRRLASFPIPAETAAEVIEHFYKLNNYIIYWSDGEHDYAFADRYIHWMDENTPTYTTLEEWLRHPRNVSNLGITPSSLSPEGAQEALEFAQEKWGSHLELHRNKVSLDICAKGVSKGAGISRMEELISGRDSEYICYAIGDAHNDLPMFQHVGKDKAYLLKNGEKDLLPYVKKSVSGIAECIEDILKD